MNQRIIFKNNNGSISIIIPTPDCLQSHTIKEIAAKDVPLGKPYKIVDVSEIPSDRTFRDAWDIDESELIDGVGGAITSFNEV